MTATFSMRDDRIRDFDFELDQLLTELVLQEHPEWRNVDGSCPSCWIEVQRLKADDEEAEQLRN